MTARRRAALLASVLAVGAAPARGAAGAPSVPDGRAPDVGVPHAPQPPVRGDTTAAPALAAALAALPPEERAGIVALLDSARSAGLPAAPLHGKVVEGVAKHAEPAQIAAVLRRVAAGLGAARVAFGAATEAELVAGGAAVQAGVTPAQLRRLRASLPRGRPATQAVVVLTDLARRGVPPADGAAALARLARAGVGDAALARLRADVAGDLAAGLGPGTAVTRRADALLRARAPGAPPPGSLVAPSPNPLDP